MNRSVLALAGLLLAGCANPIAGQGTPGAGRTSVPPSSSASTSPSTSPSSTQPSGSATPRVKPSTAIGDPAVSDLCPALGVTSLAAFGKVALDDVQWAANCSATITTTAKDELYADVEAQRPNETTPATGSKTTTVQGRTVVTSPAESGICERRVRLSGVDIVVSGDASTLTSGGDPRSCQIADKVLASTLAALAKSAPPLRTIGSPSLTALDICGAIDLTKLEKATGLTGMTKAPRRFDTWCRTTDGDVVVAAHVVFRTAGPIGTEKTRTVGTHTVLETAATSDDNYCAVTSLQRPAATVREALEVYALATGSSAPKGPRLCTIAEQATSTVLSGLGLS